MIKDRWHAIKAEEKRRLNALPRLYPQNSILSFTGSGVGNQSPDTFGRWMDEKESILEV